MTTLACAPDMAFRLLYIALNSLSAYELSNSGPSGPASKNTKLLKLLKSGGNDPK